MICSVVINGLISVYSDRAEVQSLALNMETEISDPKLSDNSVAISYMVKNIDFELLESFGNFSFR